MTRNGFSLIEVLIATAITVGTGTVVFQLFHQNERIFRDQQLITEMRQTARVVVSQIADDIRMAGQGLPPGTPAVLAGSDSSRLNLRGAFSGVASFVTAPSPLVMSVGSRVTLNLESVDGLTLGRYVHTWVPGSWGRGLVESISVSTHSVRILPLEASAPTLQFGATPSVSLDEALAVYIDRAARSVKWTNASSMADPANPVWGPANELAAHVTTLDFIYYDARRLPVVPDTPQRRAQVTSIAARVTVSTATPLSDGTRPQYSLSILAKARNLHPR